MTAPTQVGNYQLVRLLGEGGMGAVYLAEHAHGGLRAAVKVLLPHVSANRQIVARFFNEARAANRVEHPGIVKVFDMGYAEGGQAYLVMELLDGSSLASVIAGGGVELSRALEITRQVAGALDAAHAAGIVHRDLKPDNIFLVRDPDMRFGERAKLLDFGIAKLSGSLALSHGTQATMGTPTYMAPEQWRDSSQVDGRADLYSLGCLLFEMLAGRPPFLGQSLAELCHQHVYEAPPDLTALSPATPRAVADLVAAMVEKDRERRIGSMAALMTRLGALGGPPAVAPARPHELATVVAPRPAMTTTLGAGAGQIDRGPARSRVWLAGLGAVAVAAGVLVLLVAVRGGGGGAAPPDAAPALREPVAAEIPTGVDAAVEVNPFIAVAAATPGLRLGLSEAAVAAGDLGFHPQRAVLAPTQAFEIQQHEVTWGELEPWLARHPELEVRPPSSTPSDPGLRRDLPATGVPWRVADTYCRDATRGSLPTEAQWELAARGPALRAAPWGDDPASASLSVYRGGGARVGTVMISSVDRTPEGIHDLAGNAREWTADEWTEDADGASASRDGRTYHAVRGLPLDEAAPARRPAITGAYRRLLCSSGCPEDLWAKLATVGFRCAR